MNPDDLQKLVTMPMLFGKHQGKLLADLPGNDLNWFAREGFPKGEIGRLLALLKMGGRREDCLDMALMHS